MLPSIVSYRVFERAATSTDIQQSLLTPVDERETEYFRENIKRVSSPEDLLKDFRLYQYAMRAFNMDDQMASRAIVKKALEGGVTDPESFANEWPDGRYREMARIFGFAELGAENMQNELFSSYVVSQYEIVTREVRAGEENPAVRLAAYFKREAKDFTSWFHPLSTTALRDVVMTALQVPPAVQTQQDLDSLVSYLDNKFDIADFQDPEKLDEFIERYLILHDVENSVSTASSMTDASAALSILQSSGIGGSLLNITV